MQNEKKSVIPVAQAGYEEGYLESLNVTWDDTERGRKNLIFFNKCYKNPVNKPIAYVKLQSPEAAA